MYDHIGDQVFTVLFALTVALRYHVGLLQASSIVLSWLGNCLYLAAEHGIKSDMDPKASTSLFYIHAMSRNQLEFLAGKMKFLRYFGPATMNLVCGCAVASVLKTKDGLLSHFLG